MSDNQVGTVYIRVRPDADGFRSATQAKVRQELAGYYARVPLNPDLNESEMRRERNQAQSYYDRNPLEVDVNTDFDNRLVDVEDAFRRMSGRVNEVRQGVSGLRGEMSDLAQRMGNMEISVSEEDIREIRNRLANLEAIITADTSDATRSVEAWKSMYDSQSVGIDVEAEADVASAMMARAQMEAAMRPISVRTRLNVASALATMAQITTLGSRPQYVDIIPRIPMSAWLRVEAQLVAMSRRRIARMADRTFDRVWRTWTVGGLRSLAGLGDMDKILQSFDSVISELDVKGSQFVMTLTAIGSAANVAGDLLGGLLVTAADASRVIGLAAAAPTAILAGWAAMHTHRSIWQDFSDALEGHEDALERLPPNALRAVDAINELSEAVNRSIQDGFWDTMADEITRFAETVGPVLERGMQRTAEIYGETLSGMLDLAQSWAESGQLDAAFSNINRMFEGVGAGMVDIFDAFVTVGMRASRLFPRLGHTIEQAFSAVNQWAQWASETGKIDSWITTAVDTLGQLVRVGGAASEMVHGLVQAFRNAGAWGLDDVVRGFESVAGLMQSAEWQHRMGNIFSGMVEGASHVWNGFREINSVLYESHEWLRRMLLLTGQVAEVAQFRIADMLGRDQFQEGGIDILQGFHDMLAQLEPAARSFGDILGWLGSIAGEIFREMAPGINTIMGIFSDGLAIAGPSIISAIEPLTEFIENLGHTVRHNMNAWIAPGLAALLDLFTSLPAPLQRFLTLGAVMSRWLPAFGQAANRAILGISRAMGRVRGEAVPLGRTQQLMAATYRRQAQHLPGVTGELARMVEAYKSLPKPLVEVNRRAGTLLGTMQDAARNSADTWRQSRTAIDNHLRQLQPMTSAYARVGSAIETTRGRVGRFSSAVTSGMSTAGRAIRDFARNSVADVALVERSMARMQQTMRDARRGGATRAATPLIMDMARQPAIGVAALNNMTEADRRMARLERTIDRVTNAGNRMRRGLATGIAGIPAAVDRVRSAYERARPAIERFNDRMRTSSGEPRAQQIARSYSQAQMAAINSMNAIERRAGVFNARMATLGSNVGSGFLAAWDGLRDGARRGVTGATTAIRDMTRDLPRRVTMMVDGGINRAWDGMARTAGDAARGAVSRVGSALRTLPTIAQGAALGVSGAFASSFTAISLGAQGVTSLLRGMFALMGGLPGIALVGVITGLGLVRRNAAEARQSIEEMGEALARQDRAGAMRSLLDSIGDGLKDLTAAGADVSDMLNDILDGGDVGEYRAHADAILELERGWDAMGGTLEEYLNLVRKNSPEAFAEGEAAASAFGFTLEEALTLGPNVWHNLKSGLSDGAEQLEGAQIHAQLTKDAMDDLGDSNVKTGAEAAAMAERMQEAGQSFHDASSEARNFARAIETISDSTQSADSRISSMGEALKMLSGDYESNADIVVESWDRAQQAQRTATEMVEAHGEVVASETGRISRDYDDMSQRQIMAIQGATEIHESGMGRAIDAYDEAIASGIKHADAVELAGEAYRSVEGDIEKFIANSGMSKTEAEAFRGEMEALGNVDDIEIALELNVLSEEQLESAYDGLKRIRDAGLEIDGESWMAFILANPEQALLATKNTLMAFANYEAGEHIATLGADEHSAVEAIARASGLGDEWDKGDFAAVLSTILEMDDAEAAYELLMDWDSEWVEANLGAKDEATTVIEAALEELDEFDGERIAELAENGGQSVTQVLTDIRDILLEVAKEHGVDVELRSDDAQSKADAFAETLGEIDGERAEATVDADADGAMTSIEGARDAGLGFAESIFKALLDADDEAGPTADGALTTLGMIDGSWTANLFANDEASGAAESAKESASGIEGPWWARLGTTGLGGLLASTGSAVAGAGEVAKDWTANLLLSGLAGFLGGTSSAESGVKSIPDSATSSLLSDGTLIEDASDAVTKVGEIPSSASTTFSFLGNLLVQVIAARLAIGLVPDKKTTSLNASGNARNVASATRDALARVTSKSITISASGNAINYANSTKAAIAGVTSKSVILSASGNAIDMARSAQSAIANVRSKSVILSASGNAAPFAMNATRAIGNVNSKSVVISASGNVTTFATRARAAIANVRSRAVRISASGNAIDFATRARFAIMAVPSITRRIGVTTNAWAVAGSAQRAINSVRGKTVTITTRRVSANADGGMYEGQNMVRSFAAGGFNEVHRAQIATGATPYRVWAEPETGGEAYIPLAASKRARSTAIWEETGRRLGVTNKEGDTLVDNRTGATFNITNHYPQAEPTSRTVARSMDQLGSGARGW